MSLLCTPVRWIRVNEWCVVGGGNGATTSTSGRNRPTAILTDDRQPGVNTNQPDTRLEFLPATTPNIEILPATDQLNSNSSSNSTGNVNNNINNNLNYNSGKQFPEAGVVARGLPVPGIRQPAGLTRRRRRAAERVNRHRMLKVPAFLTQDSSQPPLPGPGLPMFTGNHQLDWHDNQLEWYDQQLKQDFIPQTVPTSPPTLVPEQEKVVPLSEPVPKQIEEVIVPVAGTRQTILSKMGQGRKYHFCYIYSRRRLLLKNLQFSYGGSWQ